MPNLKDIAKIANVSPATVSLALNNKKGVNKTTAERIRKIADDIGYRSANHTAYESNGKISFVKIIKHGDILNDNHNSFIASYIDGIESNATKLNYKLEILTFDKVEIRSIIKSLNTNNPDGTIILATELDEDDILALSKINPPVVFLDSYYSLLPCNFANMNNEDSVFDMISYLKNKGHEDIGLVQGQIVSPNFKLREEAFFKSLKYHKLEFNDKHYYQISSNYSNTIEEMKRQINPNDLPSVIFCVNDIMALGCIEALKMMNIRVPEDISVVGFDNLPISNLINPPLTTIDVPTKLIGQSAVDIIHKNILKTASLYPTKIQIGGRLIIRNSVR